MNCFTVQTLLQSYVQKQKKEGSGFEKLREFEINQSLIGTVQIMINDLVPKLSYLCLVSLSVEVRRAILRSRMVINRSARSSWFIP
jgi:hypothetical protein